MNINILAFGVLFFTVTLFADTLGFVEQKFSHLNFEKGKWSRTGKCPVTRTLRPRTAPRLMSWIRHEQPGAFPATKGLRVIVCGSTAAFDEGFEASPGLRKRALRTR